MKTHLIFAGCTGVGKTTIIEQLKERIQEEKVYVFSDPFVHNPFLDNSLSYGQKQFQSELFFIKEFLKIQHEIEHINDGIVLQERSIYECVHIFARQFFEQGTIDANEFDLFLDLLNVLKVGLCMPDYLVYIKAKPKDIVERIKTRGRGFEAMLDDSFIKHQSLLYDEWTESFSELDKIPLILVNSNTDIQQNVSLIERVLGR